MICLNRAINLNAEQLKAKEIQFSFEKFSNIGLIEMNVGVN